jgi:pimeloyl-ACP methyl ester carboxylesterase
MRSFSKRRSQSDRITGLNWSTLLQYARAATEFTTTPPVTLPRNSFSRLSAMDTARLPSPETMITRDGSALAFRHYVGERVAKTIVILLHGSAGYGAQLHMLANAITESGQGQVYTLDMRGHGFSGGKPGHAVSHPEQMGDDIADFLGFVGAKNPGAPIVLGGHSAGGGLVLRFSRSPAGQRVAAYYFLAPYLGLGSPTIRPLFGGWAKVQANRLRALSLANVLGIHRFNGATVVSFDVSACPNREAYTTSWSFNTLLAMGPGRWAPDALGINGDKPVLVISGDRDECFYPESYGEAFHILAPQAEVRTILDCGHWDVLVDPQAVRITLDWLSRLFQS